MASLSAIAVACLSLVLFQSFTDGVRSRFRKNLITSSYAHFQIFKRGYRENQADDAFGYQVKELPEIRQTIEKKGVVAGGAGIRTGGFEKSQDI